MIKNNFLAFRPTTLPSLKLERQRLLLTPVLFGGLLLVARTVYTGRPGFLFLVWNLFLAFVPYLLSYTATVRPSLQSNSKMAILAALWLLFVPNSFYMLTDLFHLNDSMAVPRWYDLLLILCFAFNALLMGLLSVRHMEKIVRARWGLRRDWLFIYPVMWLNALGVYIGRYLRFNSWDIISNPFRLAKDMLYLVVHPLHYKDAWAMVFCFSFFLYILYSTLKKISRAIG